MLAVVTAPVGASMWYKLTGIDQMKRSRKNKTEAEQESILKLE